MELDDFIADMESMAAAQEKLRRLMPHLFPQEGIDWLRKLAADRDMARAIKNAIAITDPKAVVPEVA